MKVCFFSINAYSVIDSRSKTSIGGTEIQLVSVASYLAREESFEISFITGDYGQKNFVVFDGIKIYKSTSLEKKLQNYIKAPFIIWSALKKVNADVYIASSAGIEIGIIALFCKIYRKKFIYRTASSIDCNDQFIKKNGFRGMLYQYGLESADVVIAQNNENRLLLKKNHSIDAITIKNSFVINDTSLVDLADREYILWVGRTEPNKQPELFFELAKRIPNEKFIMIAPKQGHLLDYFENISKKASVVENVTFTGRVPFDKIQDYFNKAKLLICTSQYEGFPNVHLQACIGGTPVVTLNINPDNYINENHLGYCADGDFEKMIDQIELLLNDEKDWKEKSENAFRYVKENHDINIVGRQWKNLLESI